MTTINVYLTFPGNCEKAFNFYKSVFGGEFSYVGRFKDMPPMEGGKPISGPEGEKLMHICLPISKETMLMGSDNSEQSGPVHFGNNFSISVNTGSKAGADRIFEALAAGGKITMPIATMFWGDYFGTVADQFGVNWMVSFNTNANQ